MQWILDHFQIVALVLLAVGSAVKQWVETSQARKREAEAPAEEDEPTWIPVPIPPELRPHTMRAPAPPPVPVTSIDEDAVLRRQLEMQERLSEIRQRKAQPKSGNAAAKAKQEKTASLPATSMRSLLARPASLRKAMVLREVLGPPVGLR